MPKTTFGLIPLQRTIFTSDPKMKIPDINNVIFQNYSVITICRIVTDIEIMTSKIQLQIFTSLEL